jgi:hypothetical protein
MKKTISFLLSALLTLQTFSFAEELAGGVPDNVLTDTKELIENDTSNQDTVLAHPLLNLFSTTQWNLFIEEFEMSLNFDWCCKKNDPLTCAFGVQAHMIEPIGYMETTKQPLYFPFADLDLNGRLIKGGYFYEIDNDAHAVRGTTYDAHFIYLPIMGMIFKKTLGFVCFHEGNMVIPYLSEFDPSWKIDIYYMKLIPHMIYLFTPTGLISTILDCVSTEVVNAITMTYGGSMEKETKKIIGDSNTFSGHKESLTTYVNDRVKDKGDRQSKSAKIIGDYTQAVRTKLNFIRDTMFYVDGCHGFSPIGGYVDGFDPIGDATLLFHGIMGVLHGASAMSPVPFLYKQTNAMLDTTALPNDVSAANADQAAAYEAKFSGLRNAIDTMCRWKPFLLPLPSQYLLQLAYPTVGAAKEVGAGGITVSTAKNIPGAKGSVYVVWDRRDYYAFAYFCKKSDYDNLGK